MAQMVKVHLVHAQNFRANKSEPYTRYNVGINEMPIEQAQAMGVAHRIIQDTPEEAPMVKDGFQGRLPEKLTGLLNEAGYSSLEDLRKLSTDELRAIKGIGANGFEIITTILKGA